MRCKPERAPTKRVIHAASAGRKATQKQYPQGNTSHPVVSACKTHSSIWFPPPVTHPVQLQGDKTRPPHQDVPYHQLEETAHRVHELILIVAIFLGVVLQLAGFLCACFYSSVSWQDAGCCKSGEPIIIILQHPCPTCCSRSGVAGELWLFTTQWLQPDWLAEVVVYGNRGAAKFQALHDLYTWPSVNQPDADHVHLLQNHEGSYRKLLTSFLFCHLNTPKSSVVNFLP